MLPLVLIAYLISSVATFVVYAIDKRRAARGRWRIPERTLHLFELFFGWPGALIAQRTLRHKTRDRRFRLIFWAIVALHAAAWILAGAAGVLT